MGCVQNIFARLVLPPLPLMRVDEIIENLALLHFLQDFHFNVQQCVPVKNSIVMETSTKCVVSPKDFVQ